MVSSRHHFPPRLTVVALLVVCLCSGWLQLAAPMSTEGQLALQTQQSQDFSGKACIEGARYGKPGSVRRLSSVSLSGFQSPSRVPFPFRPETGIQPTGKTAHSLPPLPLHQQISVYRI